MPSQASCPLQPHLPLRAGPASSGPHLAHVDQSPLLSSLRDPGALPAPGLPPGCVATPRLLAGHLPEVPPWEFPQASALDAPTLLAAAAHWDATCVAFCLLAAELSWDAVGAVSAACVSVSK